MGKLNWWRTAFAFFLLCLATVITSSAQTFSTLYNFGGSGDGAGPDGTLIQATDGNLYGTTYQGGNGFGTIFKITPDGELTTIYRFCPQSGCRDGEYPDAPVVQATDGNFYGTKAIGGSSTAGTVQVITPSGTLSSNVPFQAAP